MIKLEYYQGYVRVPDESNALVQFLNARGEEGWELGDIRISSSRMTEKTFSCIFKRQKEIVRPLCRAI